MALKLTEFPNLGANAASRLVRHAPCLPLHAPFVSYTGIPLFTERQTILILKINPKCDCLSSGRHAGKEVNNAIGSMEKRTHGTTQAIS